MGGSPHLTERQHAQHATFPSPRRNPQYPVSATRGNGLVDSQQLPDTDRHANRCSVPAAQSTASTRAETGPSSLPYKTKTRNGSSTSSRDPVPQPQTQELPGSSNNSTAQSGYSPKQPQPQPPPIEAGDPPAENLRDNGAQSSTIPKSPSKMLLGQKRTAMGVAKSAHSPQDSYSVNKTGVERRRSGSIGSLSHGNRIAALSVHLRTRLSYAASKIEKSRQGNTARLPMGLLENGSHAPPADLDSLKRMGFYHYPDIPLETHQAMDMNSPDGTTVSAPDASVPFHSQFQQEPLRASPIIRSGSSTSFTPHHDRSRSHGSTPTIPRLAPPADIIPKSSNPRRRRPNPNEAFSSQRYSPFPLHRRHHSQQEFSASKPVTNSETLLVPGTPPLQPPSGVTSTPYGHIQGTAMEQDAIETLLFMSSPGHSGYHSNSQNSQAQPSLVRNSVSNSIDSMTSSRWGQGSHHKDESDQSGSHRHGSNAGLESQAGDEIDRMLDQMDSDSEDEKPFARHHSNSLSTTSIQKKSSSGRETPGGS
ncbi:hypothetical protein P170DRAFT_471218 [Aspergillus steynii IBT 23096]|uniref:Uncharacterized protein n=1 Tax=Aspergillus steynii IBT 23096 TaxID=1392250 RepID=A0A2I2GSG7_9EURO|nr:uncharacterized protein P170DRAFT_471218 [Aspergillus steynii IBT 23096]PLB55818.1 hypothetical protein P170DRAFT_471218 [Aspergillus steynii IBT 23096]